MALPREFDPDAVLERAMQVFWAKGYETTSIDDLCDATKLNRSSLYASFGDKRALIRETIDRYGDHAVGRIAAALSRPLPIRALLAMFLAETIDRIVAGPRRSGCLIGNCAAEVARHDRAAAASVRRSLERVEREFHDAFERAVGGRGAFDEHGPRCACGVLCGERSETSPHRQDDHGPPGPRRHRSGYVAMP
jgi:TetR/AcrR family transcriptional repressor of nem operon